MVPLSATEPETPWATLTLALSLKIKTVDFKCNLTSETNRFQQWQQKQLAL